MSLETPHPQFLQLRETARFSFRVLVAMHYIVTLPYGCKSNAQYQFFITLVHRPSHKLRPCENHLADFCDFCTFERLTIYFQTLRGPCRAFISAGVQKSAREFSHGLNFNNWYNNRALLRLITDKIYCYLTCCARSEPNMCYI